MPHTIKLKVKVKLSLCLTKHHAMKTYWGSGGIAPRILGLGTRWRWVVSFNPRPLYPRERASGTYWIGGWLELRDILDTVVKRKIPSLRRKSNPRTPIVQPVAQRFTDWAITALIPHTMDDIIAVLRQDTPNLCIIIILYKVLNKCVSHHSVMWRNLLMRQSRVEEVPLVLNMLWFRSVKQFEASLALDWLQFELCLGLGY
jgi:hypothetical protein